MREARLASQNYIGRGVGLSLVHPDTWQRSAGAVARPACILRHRRPCRILPRQANSGIADARPGEAVSTYDSPDRR